LLGWLYLGASGGEEMTSWDDKDWFRSSQWSAEIEAEFEKRLARARPRSRAQYIRIQAVHLLDKPDRFRIGIGRTLLERLERDFSETDPYEVKSGTEMLADSFLKTREYGLAETTYRKLLEHVARSPKGFSGTSGLGELGLAEALTRLGGQPRLREAEQLLSSVELRIRETPFFRNSVLRYLVARARLAAKNRDGAAAMYARRALETADDSQPRLPRHPTVGIPHADARLRRELDRIIRRYGKRWDRAH
jgi:hypothetical protein